MGFLSAECGKCGSTEHATSDCPHGFFSSKRSSSDQKKTSIRRETTSSDSSSSDGSGLAWLVGGVIVVIVVIWLAVNVVLPVTLLNSALALTILALFDFRQRKTLFAALALVGGCYMLLDIVNGWFSVNFVNNVVKDPNWIRGFAYINAAAIGLSTWFLVQPIWAKARLIETSDKRKSIILTGASILLVAIATTSVPIVYHSVQNPFTQNTVFKSASSPARTPALDTKAKPPTPAPQADYGGEGAQMQERDKPYLGVINSNAPEDRKAIAEIYLKKPYEYECGMETVDKQITMYEEFIRQFPESMYVPEALMNVAWLELYSLQCPIPNNEKITRLETAKFSYKRIFTEHGNQDWGITAREIYEVLLRDEKKMKGIGYSKLNEMHDKLVKQIPLSAKTPAPQADKVVRNALPNSNPSNPPRADGVKSPGESKYTDNGNGTITDKTTGLTWQKGENAARFNWYQASGTYDEKFTPSTQNVCGSLSLAGSGWRLPTKDELFGLFDKSFKPTINTTYFPNAYAYDYWSSTPYNTNIAWYVPFGDGSVNFTNKSDNYYVRCVRGGQVNPGTQRAEEQQRKTNNNKRQFPPPPGERDTPEIKDYLAAGRKYFDMGKYELCISKMEEVLKRDKNHPIAIQHIRMANERINKIKKEFSNPTFGGSE